ncbi:MAG: hypothetical protein KZQ89_02335 [Candidatus Thiodiazotropha sp. (ex Lucinoma kastoroae)]|nr:hypothetical protein [Candidatus Thiodiazotropha sp. (ex Lucinoma kastoroae)]
MNIRTTTDPITLRDVSDLDDHPCLYEGDGDHGVAIYFESEFTKRIYQNMVLEDRKIVCGNDTDDYVAEG